MPKTYRLQYILDDSQPTQAWKRQGKFLSDYETSLLRIAKLTERVFSGTAAGATRQAEGMAEGFKKAAQAAEGFAAATEKATSRAGSGLPALAQQMTTLPAVANRLGSAIVLSMGQINQGVPKTTGLLRQLQMEAKAWGGQLAIAGKKGNESFGLMLNPALEVRRAATGIKDALGETADNAGKAEKGVSGFLTKMLAMRAASKAFSEVMDASEKLEAYWQKIAGEATSFRDSLREVASLKNQGGPNDQVVAGSLGLALATGTTADKARAAEQAYENIGPTVRDKGHYAPANGMTPEQLERAVLAEGIKTGRRMGIDEATSAEAVGVAGLYSKFTSPEQAMQQVGGALKGIQEGKLSYNKGVTALGKGAAKLVDSEEAAAEGAAPGRLKSYSEAGVYLGALSLGTGTADQAQHRMVQNSRVLNPDATKEDQRKALAEAGITSEMSDPEKLIQLRKYLKAKGVKSPRDWLAERGLGTVATREGMEASLKVADVLEQRLGNLRASERTNAVGKQVMADNASFMEGDKAASAAGVGSVRDVLNKAQGIEGPEQFEQAKAAAEERLRLQGGAQSVGRSLTNSFMTPLSYLTSGVSGWGQEQEQRQGIGAIPTLRAEADRLGIDIYKQFPGLSSGDYETRARAFSQAADAVRAAGGDPMGLKGLKEGARRRIEALSPSRPPAIETPAKAAMNGGGIPGMGWRSALASTAMAAMPSAGGGVGGSSVDQLLRETNAILGSIHQALAAGARTPAPIPVGRPAAVAMR